MEKIKYKGFEFNKATFNQKHADFFIEQSKKSEFIPDLKKRKKFGKDLIEIEIEKSKKTT